MLQDVELFRRSFGEHADVRTHINRRLFQGTSLQFRDVESAPARAAELAQLPGIKGVHSVNMIDIPDEVVWRGRPDKGYNSMMRRRDLNEDDDDEDNLYDEDANSPHVMTQVDKLRNKGYTGKGIKVAVVDTGIDYKHPALGGCFGKGCLVSYGRDLVGDSYPSSAAKPDDDPMDCNGHGTHVAGIIAAQSNPFGFTGAAPGVELGAYKVFGCTGGVFDEQIIDGFYAAEEDGSDIINASLGSQNGWSSSLLSSAINRLTEKGVICIVAAGNEGKEGLFYGADPSSAESVSSVASFQNIRTPVLVTEGTFEAGDDDEESFGFHAGVPAAWSSTVSLPLYATSEDIKVADDACDPLPDDTPDLSKYITLIRRGSCSPVDQINHAVAHGAEYVILYNNEAGVADIVASETNILAVAMVEARQGESWARKLKAGIPVKLRMVDPATSDDFLLSVENKGDGGFPNSFTTWGPTWELNAKPNFGAPGGNILSTYPLAKGSYSVSSGTSMATPLVAGAVALLCEARGTRDPVEIRNLLAASAVPSRFHDGAKAIGLLAPVPQQGAGMIQIFDAAVVPAQFNVASLSFNDSDHFTGEQQFEIRNTGVRDIEYEFDHRPAATVYTHRAGTNIPMKFPNDLKDEYATVTMSPSRFTVRAGRSVKLTVRAKPPSGLDRARLPVWSGFVTLHSSDRRILSLPYIGVSGSMYDQDILGADTGVYISAARIKPNATIELPYQGNADISLDVLPLIGIDVIFGTAQLLVDLVPAGSMSKEADDLVHEHLGLETVGRLRNMDWVHMSRIGQTPTWDGRLDGGKFAPEGRYKIVIRALRNFGNPKDEDDFQRWDSPAFNIKYKQKPERTQVD